MSRAGLCRHRHIIHHVQRRFIAVFHMQHHHAIHGVCLERNHPLLMVGHLVAALQGVVQRIAEERKQLHFRHEAENRPVNQVRELNPAC